MIYENLHEARHRITRLEAQNARLREALEIAGPMAMETASASVIKKISEALASTSPDPITEAVAAERDRRIAVEQALAIVQRKLTMAYGRLHELDNPDATHKHKKTGGLYRIGGEPMYVGETRTLKEGDVLVFYVGATGHSFTRLRDEFEDGRFERLPYDWEQMRPEVLAKEYDKAMKP
jgi:hypothetical protein